MRAARLARSGAGKICATLFDSDSEALTQLGTLDARAAKVIELRFFGGLTETEASEALDISIATLKRDWDFARSWLATHLAG
jgi:DNA-directed RNA polymerase specialized sigma24 family protein